MHRPQPLPNKHRQMRAPALRPRPLPPPLLNWSTSGGPRAARKNAGRVTIATATAIRIAPRSARKRARSRWRLRVKPATAPSANVTAADAASATRNLENPAAMRRPRLRSPVVAADAAPAAPDKGRPPRERFQGKGRDGRDKGKFAGKPKGDRDGGRPGGGPSHRQYASSAPPRERERPIDPNSPFAKLAALREQLTAGRKE